MVLSILPGVFLSVCGQKKPPNRDAIVQDDVTNLSKVWFVLLESCSNDCRVPRGQNVNMLTGDVAGDMPSHDGP